MGIFSSIRKNWDNAKANVSCQIQMEGETFSFFEKTGLEIQHGYQKARNFLGGGGMNEQQIRENCWGTILADIVKAAKEIGPNRNGDPDVEVMMCFLAGLAFDRYRDGHSAVMVLNDAGVFSVTMFNDKDFESYGTKEFGNLNEYREVIKSIMGRDI